MLRRVLGWERDEDFYNPYDHIEEDLERTGMPIKKAKFISRFCRSL